MVANGRDTIWDDVPEHLTRVLVECPPGSSPLLIAAAIERHGYAVRTCEGPDRRHPCALVEQGACSLVDGADVVVNLLNGPDPDARLVLDHLSRQRRPPEVVTELTQPEIDRLSATDEWTFRRDHVEILASPLTSEALLAAIDAAAARAVRGAPTRIDAQI
jgi:hypothetical protein